MSMDDDDDDGGQMIFGDLRGLKLPNICLTGEEKPRKNLTQETCPDRGSNPGPLRDRCACYHLGHSCGPLVFYGTCFKGSVPPSGVYKIDCKDCDKIYIYIYWAN